jgi:hypothetical protein
MRFSLFDQWGARNSLPVWHAFRAGLQRLGLTEVSHDFDADVAVIWSVVWAGRMRANREVWRQFRNSGRPVVVLEVGSLRRGHTWKMAVNGLGQDAYWGQGISAGRPQTLGLTLGQWQPPGQDILIALQRHDSEQWAGKPPMQQWLDSTVRELRRHTNRVIKIRKHPRQNVQIPSGCVLEKPQAIANTYDDFDFDQSISKAWSVINVNSGAGVRAAMLGVPVFCDSSSLAAPVANLDWSKIESPQRPDREHWFQTLCHTEWTCEEIASGHPLTRLMSGL